MFSSSLHRVYSKISPDLLLSVIFQPGEPGRTDLCDAKESLQVSYISSEKGSRTRAHRHKLIQRVTDVTQEAWIVVSGAILVGIYDTDMTRVGEWQINSGGCAILYSGGHDFQSLTEDTFIYEVKNGPYFGASADREYFE